LSNKNEFNHKTKKDLKPDNIKFGVSYWILFKEIFIARLNYKNNKYFMDRLNDFDLPESTWNMIKDIDSIYEEFFSLRLLFESNGYHDNIYVETFEKDCQIFLGND